MVYQSTVVSELAIREIAGYVLKKKQKIILQLLYKKKEKCTKYKNLGSKSLY